MGPLLSASNALGPQLEGPLSWISCFKGPHSGPLPAMPSPERQGGIYLHSATSFKMLICAPGTTTVLLLQLHHSANASKTVSVILSVILTTYCPRLSFTSVSTAATSYEISMFKGPHCDSLQADKIGKSTVIV